MNKNIIKKLFLITGIIISLFSIFLDTIYKNNFYFGASQLILLLIGISLIIGYWSNKILIWMIGLIIGINLVIFNKQYFQIGTCELLLQFPNRRKNQVTQKIPS